MQGPKWSEINAVKLTNTKTRTNENAVKRVFYCCRFHLLYNADTTLFRITVGKLQYINTGEESTLNVNMSCFLFLTQAIPKFLSSFIVSGPFPGVIYSFP